LDRSVTTASSGRNRTAGMLRAKPSAVVGSGEALQLSDLEDRVGISRPPLLRAA
jgi:hypothetical protein